VGTTERTCGRNGTTESRALPVMFFPPPPTHNSHPRRFWEGHEFTRADRASSLIVPSGREPARKALFSIRRSCKADSSELKFLGMTERKRGPNGTTKSRAPPVMSSPPPQTHNSLPRRSWDCHEFTGAARDSSLLILQR